MLEHVGQQTTLLLTQFRILQESTVWKLEAGSIQIDVMHVVDYNAVIDCKIIYREATWLS